MQSGTLFDTPVMPSWGGYQIDSLIRESFPYARVFIENEANAMAFGELRKGEARSLQNLVYVNVGSSINSGIILNGQIYRGANGRAGDIGQMHVEHKRPGSDGEEVVPLGAVVSGLGTCYRSGQALVQKEGGRPVAARRWPRGNQGLIVLYRHVRRATESALATVRDASREAGTLPAAGAFWLADRGPSRPGAG